MKEIKIGMAGQIPLKVGYPETEEELEAMFRLRAEVYKQDGYITAENDIDEYDLDNKCVYFIAKLNDEIVGTARGIIDDPLPTELYFDFEEPEEIARIPRNKRGEVSRLITIAKGMNHLVSLSLFKALIEFGRENDFLGGYAFIQRFLMEIIDSLGIPIYRIHPYTLNQEYKKTLFQSHLFEQGEVLPTYFLRDRAAEFMEKMKL